MAKTEGKSFNDLPWELRHHVLNYVFEPTPYDYAGTKIAELRIYTDHVMLRRTSPRPPQRLRGCRNLMLVNRRFHDEVLEAIFGQIDFEIHITGGPQAQPLYNRQLSEYPLGRTAACPALCHVRNIKLFLNAWGDDEIETLKIRLSQFLAATAGNRVLTVKFIGFYCTSSSATPGSADQIARMLGSLKSSVSPEVYNSDQSVSKECLDQLLDDIGAIDV